MDRFIYNIKKNGTRPNSLNKLNALKKAQLRNLEEKIKKAVGNVTYRAILKRTTIPPPRKRNNISKLRKNVPRYTWF